MEWSYILYSLHGVNCSNFLKIYISYIHIKEQFVSFKTQRPRSSVIYVHQLIETHKTDEISTSFENYIFVMRQLRQSIKCHNGNPRCLTSKY